MAANLLGLDQLLQMGDAGRPFTIEPHRAVASQHGFGLGVLQLERGRPNSSAIAAGRAVAGLLRLEHRNLPPGTRGAQCGGEAGEAGADDGDVGFLWQRRRLAGRARGLIPPERSVFDVF